MLPYDTVYLLFVGHICEKMPTITKSMFIFMVVFIATLVKLVCILIIKLSSVSIIYINLLKFMNLDSRYISSEMLCLFGNQVFCQVQCCV